MTEVLCGSFVILDMYADSGGEDFLCTEARMSGAVRVKIITAFKPNYSFGYMVHSKPMSQPNLGNVDG